MTLIKGTVIQFTDGTTGVVVAKFGEGGQGEVYKIEYKGETSVLKWYRKRPSQDFINNLKRNAASPSPFSCFLWPKAVTDTGLGVGYVMDFAGQGSKEFSKFLINAARWQTEEALISAAINLCIAYQKLHLRGLAYFDLNDGNFFFNPNDGKVYIGDNDNVSAASFNVSNIGGKQGYMAPEIYLGNSPNRYSDYFSLAIILFRMIFVDHPLHGKYMEKAACLTPGMIKYIYGENPVFIFDPSDKSNAASNEFSPNALKRWGTVPGFVRDAFIKAFSKESVKNPQKRMIESEWIKILLKWRAALCKCPVCNKLTYIETQDKGVCKECHKSYSAFWMQIGKGESIPLVSGQIVYTAQLGLDSKLDKVAEIVSSMIDKKKLGIRNVSSFDWMVTYEGLHKVIKPGESFRLCDDMSIRFSNMAEARIKLVNPL